MIISVGDRLSNGNYIKHSEFERVINYSSPNTPTLLSICKEDVCSHPSSIKVDNELFKSFQSIDDITISDEDAYVSGKTISTIFSIKENIFNSMPNLKMATASCIDDNLDNLMHYLSEIKPNSLLSIFKKDITQNSPFIARFKEHLQKIETDNNLTEFIKKIKGLGIGLTPSGDDFIVGLIAALYIIENALKLPTKKTLKILKDNSLGDNPFSNTYISLALENSFSEHVKNFIEAMAIPSNEESVIKHAEYLLSFGETSGSDLLAGIIIGLKRRNIWLLKD